MIDIHSRSEVGDDRPHAGRPCFRIDLCEVETGSRTLRIQGFDHIERISEARPEMIGHRCRP